METGIANLTQDDAPALLHFDDGQTQQWLLVRLEEEEVEITGKIPRPSFGTIFLNLLPWIILIGLWIFFFRQVQQGGNRAFQFGRSKAKLLTGDTPKVTFGDVAGADEAKRHRRVK